MTIKNRINELNNRNDLLKVNRNTRAGVNGKLIYCPRCGKEHRVYHFSWVSIECSVCKGMIDKEEFYYAIKRK